MATVPAEPYGFELEPRSCALVMIGRIEGPTGKREPGTRAAPSTCPH